MKNWLKCERVDDRMQRKVFVAYKYIYIYISIYIRARANMCITRIISVQKCDISRRSPCGTCGVMGGISSLYLGNFTCQKSQWLLMSLEKTVDRNCSSGGVQTQGGSSSYLLLLLLSKFLSSFLACVLCRWRVWSVFYHRVHRAHERPGDVRVHGEHAQWVTASQTSNVRLNNSSCASGSLTYTAEVFLSKLFSFSNKVEIRPAPDSEVWVIGLLCRILIASLGTIHLTSPSLSLKVKAYWRINP